MLTQAAAHAARPRPSAYKIFDAGGLHLHVAPSGTKSWRLKYRKAGREQLATLGRFPAISLAEARIAADRARDGRRVATFEQLTRAWHAHNLARWSPAHAAQVLGDFERDVFPAIGDVAPDEISSPELLAVLRAIELRGARATARRLRQRFSAVFGYGIAEGLASLDPAATLTRALAAPRLVESHRALTLIEDCRALLLACDRTDAARTEILAHRFLALTAVRFAAVRGARWDEISLVPGPDAIWTIPAERMKLARAKKASVEFDHVVPLSPAAVEVLSEAAKSSPPAPGQLIFGHIGEGALRELIRRAGFADRHVPHGWRASFSTILREDRQDGETIERALAHVERNKVRAAYDRARLLADRRALFERWGALLAGDD